VAAQFVVRENAREVHERALRRQIPIAQRAQRIVRRVPRRRRIDDEQRAPVVAITTRDQEGAHPQILLA
jgi:hypothetical protein